MYSNALSAKNPVRVKRVEYQILEENPGVKNLDYGVFGVG